jgi:hypothetical protein
MIPVTPRLSKDGKDTTSVAFECTQSFLKDAIYHFRINFPVEVDQSISKAGRPLELGKKIRRDYPFFLQNLENISVISGGT